MITRVETITNDLKKCSGRCRRCRWRDRFSGECMRVNNALEYIKIIEADNATEKVYCKECVYCQKKEPAGNWDTEKYRCMFKEGLSTLYVEPMDYCSKGVASDV